MGYARGVSDETGITGEAFQSGGVGKTHELAVIGDGQDQVSIGHRKDLIRYDVGMCIAHPPGQHAADKIVRRLICEACDLAVEKRHVDALPFARARLMKQRGLDGDGRVQTGDEIADRDADFHRLRAWCSVRLAG